MNQSMQDNEHRLYTKDKSFVEWLEPSSNLVSTVVDSGTSISWIKRDEPVHTTPSTTSSSVLGAP